MKNIKRILALLLTLLMLVSTFVACKSNDEESKESTDGTVSTASGTEVETNEWGERVYSHNIPDTLNYGGKVINVVVRDSDGYGREWTTEEKDSSLDLEVFNRNLTVQEQLGITFNFIRIADNEQKAGGATPMSTAIEAAGKSGGADYDIINQYRNDAGNTNLMAYYKNLRSDEFTYFNLDHPYWSQHCNEALASDGKQYFIVGDINLSLWDRAIVTFFNKAKLSTYARISENELYQTVIDGGWTYEMFYNIVKDIHEEGDDISGKSEGDLFGVCGIRGSEASDGLLYSWNVKLTETTVDGYHQIVTDTNKTKLTEAGEKLLKLWQSAGAMCTENTTVNTEIFTSGNAIFTIDTMWHNDSHLTALKAMKDGYGIVPTPKYDADQTEYYTGVQDAHSVMCVMYGNKDFEMISAALELLAYESYNKVRPYYVQTIIKARNLDDATSGEMFDIIMSGVTMDFCDMWEGSDPKTRWLLWRKPFQYTVRDDKTSLSFVDAYAEQVDPLNAKFEDIDLFLDSAR